MRTTSTRGSDAGRHDAEPPERCVGVTILVPEPLAGSLESWRASFGDPMAAVVPPHITLVTTTVATDWAATLDHVRHVAAQQRPFEVGLRGTGSFRPVSPVVFLQLTRGFEECARLHGMLQRGPLERETEFPFHPHITVAHDVSEAGMDAAEEQLGAFEASFEVRSMGLYEHLSTGIWTLREELHFGEAPHGTATVPG